MSILTQNLEFSRCVLIARVCKKALKSGADEFQYGLESRSKIDEKSSQNGFEIRLLASWFLASLLTPILDRFLVDFRNPSRTKIDQKRHGKNNAKKKGTWMSKKSQKDPITPRGGVGPDPRRGGRGRGKPLLQKDYWKLSGMLNHL